MSHEEKSFSLKDRRLMISIPAYDGKLNIGAAFALPQLALDSKQFGFHLQLAHMSGSSIITRARNALVHQFMLSDCTDMLFIDADINFKNTDVLRLLALSGDKDVVCGAYPRRGGKTSFFTDLDFTRNGEVIHEDGLLRVKRIGTGFMLIRRHVIERLIERHPEWRYHVDVDDSHHYAVFDFQATPEGYIGEDYLFCDRVREAGMQVHLDPEVNLGHFGSQEFTGNFQKDVVEPFLKVVPLRKAA